MSGLFTAARTLTVNSPAIPVLAGTPALVPLKLEGVEGINSLFEYKLTLQTPDALNFMGSDGSNFDLASFIGLELTCSIELEGLGHFVPGLPGGSGSSNQGAGVREINGLITDARFIGESSRHALYEIRLSPWLHLATLTTDCKVFQDQTPVEIIESVLADYPFSAEKRLIETYPQRDYTVQYNETDFEFITRLMQEWGINYHFEHSGGVHRLIWSDHNAAFQVTQQDQKQASSHGPSAYHQIPFYPLGHKIDREYIHGFAVTEQITSGSYASRDYDYTRPRATLDAKDSSSRKTGHADLEVFLWRGDKNRIGGSDYSQPNRGADKAANQTEEQGHHLARLRMQALRQSGNRASGIGHVRGIVPGCTFHLTKHPKESANTEYTVLDTSLVIENVGEDAQRNTEVPYVLSDAQHLTGQWRVEVTFDVQPTTEALRPVATQPKPKTGGPETALVVGPSSDTAESNIYTDTLGRVKVQFPWDRYGGKNQNSSCWLRVAHTCAGNQLGAMQTPRIGQEVIVGFLGGDPNQPIVTGSLHNAANMPPWSLPSNQAISGIRSRELNPGGGNSAAGRSNHLILDDTEQKIQAQLKSDHQHSSLSLGQITRIEDYQGRKDPRGEGFELRTDGHGVLRAKDGLLISTEARTNAQAHAKEMGETTQRLEQAQNQHAQLGDLARQLQAQEPSDQGDVAKALQEQNDAIEGKGSSTEAENGKFPELSESHLVFSSPVGIASTTQGSTHQHSNQHHAITSGLHTSISAAKSFLASALGAVKFFAGGGIKLWSAQGHIDIAASQKSFNAIAKMGIYHTADTVVIRAEELLEINGGGSGYSWSDPAIELNTPGQYRTHADDHGHPPGQSDSMEMKPFPTSTPEATRSFSA